jgi:two-component system NtrC family sensor kinase
LAPEVRRHLFEPFYTTKDVGQGTGLGLSICYGIISEHHGKIWAESTEGGGTVFHVELPVVQEPVGVGRQASAEMVAPSPGRRVLVVEDERDVAQLLRRVLVADGHTVILAEDGNEAVEHLQALGEDGLDLVISDIKMPGLGGPALYKRLKRDYPSLVKRMVIITGDMMNAATRGFLRETGLPYLTKPFGLDDLKFKMTELLRE